jgi:hypothetical protein
MPLSKKKDKERKKFQPNSNLNEQTRLGPGRKTLEEIIAMSREDIYAYNKSRNVGNSSGMHPFDGMSSVIFTPVCIEPYEQQCSKTVMGRKVQ